MLFLQQVLSVSCQRGMPKSISVYGLGCHNIPFLRRIRWCGTSKALTKSKKSYQPVNLHLVQLQGRRKLGSVGMFEKLTANAYELDI